MTEREISNSNNNCLSAIADTKPIGVFNRMPTSLPVGAATNSRIPTNILHEKITNTLMIIGVPVHLSGYHFLREALILSAGDFDMINCITKKLYPLVAKRFNTNSGTIERGIRNVIETMYNRGKIINLNTLFGVDMYEKYDRPSNGELIALLAEKIYLDCI